MRLERLLVPRLVVHRDEKSPLVEGARELRLLAERADEEAVCDRAVVFGLLTSAVATTTLGVMAAAECLSAST
jgi:hypothetical protein